MILFCLPYAGGSEASFYQWNDHLSKSIKLHSIPLKGRGSRFNEDFYESLEDAVDDIFDNIKDKIGENDYAIYGHSMGSLLAYELYYKIKEMGHNIPKHIFFSGHRAPNRERKKDISFTLPDEDFKNKIIELGGTPEELISNQELFELFLPILKSDFKIVETYKYKERMDKIECDISVLNGKNDSISLEEVLDWKNHTNGNFRTYYFEGNHFYINHNMEEIMSILNNTLRESN
ncbi:hypothetical protein IEE_05211 [Bacillus cereus BAG5X1-1]|uniref:Thioesterase domain-containing protein n=1 Tax=Bacillus cereus BAG5X1-1 TaxID=1053189 RepID=J8AD58_BACCE|nr:MULTISPECIES: thioesterase domain-containing protein [Bacillus cereus group]EJQ37425.1 hypothetical protein IEE_05211 [Bacillus cereus BAG5X1-1]PEU19692.1 thioesterase [Bacillus wiedmannii]